VHAVAGASPGQKCGVDTHGERGARAYNGVWGQRAPSGAPGQGSEAENLLVFGCPMEAAKLPHSPYFANSLNPRYL